MAQSNVTSTIVRMIVAHRMLKGMSVHELAESITEQGHPMTAHQWTYVESGSTKIVPIEVAVYAFHAVGLSAEQLFYEALAI